MHIDMDAFYASVEVLDCPELRGKALVVGGTHRSVVSAASYEARKFGIHSAMPMTQALRLYPHVIVRPVRMARYLEISEIIMEFLETLSPLVEPVSCDEAYVDITGTERLFGPPEQLAMHAKTRIRELTGGLTCSAGIAPVRFLAKIASDMRKPDGLVVIPPDQVANILAPLPIGRLPGVGNHTEDALKRLGIRTIGDVRKYPREWWQKKVGNGGIGLWEMAHGIDATPIVSDVDAKSTGAEDTLVADTFDRDELSLWIRRQAESVAEDLRRKGYYGRTVRLKIKFSDFTQITRQTTLSEPSQSTKLLADAALELLDNLDLPRPVRLIGVTMANLTRGVRQPTLFVDEELARLDALDNAIDKVRDRFGHASVRRGGREPSR
ncbi:MAG: DNA polymerase IV [Candidatus Riflebacteria bacterium]|nr:DNA polymerase IV [Candidatus Riflebacteria bacterium]